MLPHFSHEVQFCPQKKIAHTVFQHYITQKSAAALKFPGLLEDEIGQKYHQFTKFAKKMTLKVVSTRCFLSYVWKMIELLKWPQIFYLGTRYAIFRRENGPFWHTRILISHLKYPISLYFHHHRPLNLCHVWAIDRSAGVDIGQGEAVTAFQSCPTFEDRSSIFN